MLDAEWGVAVERHGEVSALDCQCLNSKTDGGAGGRAMGLPSTNTRARRERREGSGERPERRVRGKNCSAHGAANTAEFNKRVEGRNGFPFKP